MLALWKDAEAVSDEVIAIGSPADARNAGALHLLALGLGDGTLSDARDGVRDEETLDGPTPQHQLDSLLWDALVAAADCSPNAAEIVAATAVRGQDLYAAGVITDPTLPLLADAYAMNRDIDGAIAVLQQANDRYRTSGDLGHASTYILNQALLMLERGDSDQGVLPLVDEAEACTSPYDVISVSYGRACRAMLALRSGNHQRAQRLAQEALQVVDRSHQTWQQADLRRALSVVARATGDQALERRMLDEAAAMYARKEIRSYDAEIQRRLDELGRVGQ
jgi:tetratricopeptide (TPR) repeat protein